MKHSKQIKEELVVEEQAVVEEIVEKPPTPPVINTIDVIKDELKLENGEV